MPDTQTLTMMACLALLLIALAALVSVRASRADCARLRGEAAAAARDLEQARTDAEVARAHGDGHARQVADRDGRIREALDEVAGLRLTHKDAEARCADLERRCARATEAVERLETVERKLSDDVERHAGLHRDEQALHARLRADHAALRADTDGRLASSLREVEALKELRAEMTREFQALAHQTLKETGTQLGATHTESLTALLTPFKEQVNKFEAELREVHRHAGLDRAVLHEHMKALTEQTQAVSQDAANLARALKGDKQRQGAWGEAQLERYLELMGYRRDVDFVVQASVTGDEGDRKRPDLVLRLPGDKTLVIDSKVSLSAYAEAVAAEDEAERERWLRLHAKNVRDRIDELAERDYQGLVDGSIDMVMLFMPIEGAVSAAWAYDGELAAYAMSKGVGLVYPTSLLMALKTVRHLWNVEKRNKNAEAIAERAGRLFDKLSTFIESFNSVGRAIEAAQAAHGRAVGQLSKGAGNLVGQVQKLKDLGARTGKSLGIEGDADPDEKPADIAANVDAPFALPAAE